MHFIVIENGSNTGESNTVEKRGLPEEIYVPVHVVVSINRCDL